MSKIYEALLRAEIERITGKVVPEPILETSESSQANAADNERPELLELLARLPAAAPPLEPAVTGPEPAALETPSALRTELRSMAKPTRWVPDMRTLLALNQRGMEVEQIRGLRARVHELRHYNPELKVIQVCSAVSGEGKSFIAANLALSLANHKSHPVLLIDGDMRRGTLHKLLGAPSEPGLTEYLAGTADLPAILQAPAAEVTRRPDMRGLDSLSFIPFGRDAENAADLSGNGSFMRLLNTVRESFEWIIVDSSPVNLVADGVNLARAADGVLVVMRAGVTRFEAAQRAVAELRAANVLGAVLNAVKDVKPTGGYYGY